MDGKTDLVDVRMWPSSAPQGVSRPQRSSPSSLALTGLESARPVHVSEVLVNAFADGVGIRAKFFHIIAAVSLAGLGSVFAIGFGWADEGLNRAIGKALFERHWVPAPSSTKANDGLGPLFNARPCAQCHAAATAGRLTQSPTDGHMEAAASTRLPARGGVIRLSGADGASHPHFGAQVQTQAIPGFRSEADVTLTWRTRTSTLQDGSAVELRQPSPALGGLAAPLDPGTTATLILAPSLRVIARAAEVDLNAIAAPSHLQGGSGRLSRDAHGPVLDFGRKASERSLEDIIATAFSRDLCMSTAQHPEPSGDCTPRQQTCRSAISGVAASGVEIPNEIIVAIADFVRGLDNAATPAPDAFPEGARVFDAVGCAACHTPSLPGKLGGEVAIFSDLRLHDVGEDLAGLSGGEGQTPMEWRTAPLLDINQRLKAGATLMHDGRARTIAEAILWHGGEADGAKRSYMNLNTEHREALERFLMGQ